MARQKGTLSLSSNIEPSMNAPLDGREVVNLLTDLTASGSFPYFYEGMQVYVKETSKTYTLTGNDPTVSANWKASGSDITIDSVPTAESTNAVSSGGTYSALEEKADLVNGKVPATQLPSYVDDVIEGYYKVADGKFYEESTYETEIPGESGKSYVDLSTNKSYRWSGSAFVRVDEGVSLGETSETAYRGDRGKIAYDDSQTNKTAIGTLANLATTVKTNLVSAINEIKNSLKTVATTGAFDDLTGRPDASSNIDMSEVCTPLPSNATDGIIYSTTERKVGQWIDGKPLYEKTINFGTLPNNTVKNVAHGISNISQIVDIKCITFSSSVAQSINSAAIQPGTTNGLSFYRDGSNIVCNTNLNLAIYNCYVTIQYTKTTD